MFNGGSCRLIRKHCRRRRSNIAEQLTNERFVQGVGNGHLEDMPTTIVDSVSDNTQTTSTNNILDPLREACAHGRTEEARKLLTEWKNNPNPVPRRPPKRPTVLLHPALLAAVQENHLATASMLLDEGFLISYEEVRAALTNRSTAMLEVFLNHGWNINRTLGPSMAPGLT